MVVVITLFAPRLENFNFDDYNVRPVLLPDARRIWAGFLHVSDSESSKTVSKHHAGLRLQFATLYVDKNGNISSHHIKQYLLAMLPVRFEIIRRVTWRDDEVPFNVISTWQTSSGSMEKLANLCAAITATTPVTYEDKQDITKLDILIKENRSTIAVLANIPHEFVARQILTIVLYQYHGA